MTQYIELPDVAIAAAGSPALKMSDADNIAARIPSLHAAVSGRDPGKFATAWRERLNGTVMTQRGAALTVADRDGHPAVVGSTNQAGLSIKTGPRQRLCVVVAAYLGASFQASSSAVFSPASIYNADSYKWMLMNVLGGAAASNPSKWRFAGLTGSFISDPHPGVVGWRVAMLDLYVPDLAVDSATYRFAINGAAPVAGTAASLDLLNSYMAPEVTLGNGGVQNMRTDCGVGEMYVFNNSVQTDSAFAAQVSQLVASLKTQYGIAG